jgi:hypothetical protein
MLQRSWKYKDETYSNQLGIKNFPLITKIYLKMFGFTYILIGLDLNQSKLRISKHTCIQTKCFTLVLNFLGDAFMAVGGLWWGRWSRMIWIIFISWQSSQKTYFCKKFQSLYFKRFSARIKRRRFKPIISYKLSIKII